MKGVLIIMEDKSPPPLFDRQWHLAKNEEELALTDLEFALFRSYEAFGRWQSECLATVTGEKMSSTDNAILHIIRMRGRPKGIKEIAMLFNRDDIPNLQYSVRKLLNAGLIKKNETTKGQKRGVRYTISQKGIEVTNAFAEIRRQVLVNFVKRLSSDMPEATRLLEVLSGIYDQSARIAATHRPHDF